MRIGSLFAGIGGLDLAAEWSLGGSSVWQLDLTGSEVRARHWPDARQIAADVNAVDPDDLPAVDVLCAGFACQDLSTAGAGAGLDAGTRTGPTYRGTLRFAGAEPGTLADGQVALDRRRRWRPEVVVLENVPALLTGWRERLESDFGALGYALAWVRCGAWDAGAPHIRRRVFVVATLGGRGGYVMDAPESGRWSPERAERTWATPAATAPNETEPAETWHARRAELAERHGNNGAGEPLGQQVRTWASPKASDVRSPGPSDAGARQGSDGLACEVRPWPTPCARDYKTGDISERVGTPSLSQSASDYPRGTWGARLNPDWVETLQGFPVGWTRPAGGAQGADRAPAWPRGRYPESWNRADPWPGYAWEPPRTLPDGPPLPGRPARIRALGNAVCPQQGALAIRTALAGPAQPGLFGAAGKATT